MSKRSLLPNILRKYALFKYDSSIAELLSWSFIYRIHISFPLLLGRLPPGSKVSLGPFTLVGATATEVFDLTYNTKGNISTITFKSKTEARWLVVHSSEKDLGILELEVYSGFPSGEVSLKGS